MRHLVTGEKTVLKIDKELKCKNEQGKKLVNGSILFLSKNTTK